MKINNKPESPKADRATHDKVRKILPLLNSNNPAEAQAAAVALGRFDMRDVAASLQEPMRSSRDIIDQWRDEQKKAMQLRLDELRKRAQVMLSENNPLLTKIDRRSLHKIAQLELSTRHDLGYWSKRLRVVRWQTTPGTKELENALSVAARHSQSAKNSMHKVFDSTTRVQFLETIAAAKAAIIEAEARAAKVPVSQQ